MIQRQVTVLNTDYICPNFYFLGIAIITVNVHVLGGDWCTMFSVVSIIMAPTSLPSFDVVMYDATIP